MNRRLLCGLAAVVALAGCGTTVSSERARQAAAGAAADLGVGGAATASVGTGAGGAPAAAAGRGSTSVTTTAQGASTSASAGLGPSGTSTSPVGAGGARSSLVPANGAPGVTDTSVGVGYEYIESGDLGGAAGGVGLQGAAVGNTRAEAQAVIDYINSHGGVAGGRKIVGIPYKQNPSDDAPTHDQAACSYYTEDHHAFAAMAIDDGMDACLHQHRTVSIASVFSRGIARKYPHDVFAPGIIEAVQGSVQLAERLHAYHYFDPGMKLGVVYDPDRKDAYENGFVPTLRKFGVTVTSSAEVSEGSSSVVADMQSVQLQFATKGIDHVVILNTGLLAFVFMQQAQSQDYHPRYGLWSGNQPSLLESQAFARDQLPKSVGMGWSPALDVDQSHQQPTAAQKQCDAIMASRQLYAVSSIDHALQLAYCTTFFFAAEAMNTALGLDTLDFQAAVEALGRPTLSAALDYGESYAVGKHWGTGAVRMIAFESACGCFVYRSGALPI
jgi:hypothetical protein